MVSLSYSTPGLTKRRSSLPGSLSAVAGGFSLVEVLVAMLVLAIGVIGAVGLQLAALRTAQQSMYQTSALQIAADIADTIHAWRSLPETSRDEAPLPVIDYNSADGADPDAPSTLCFTDSCDAQALFEFESYQWKTRIKSALPSGRVLVCYDSEPWDEGKKTLRWSCSGTSGGNTPLVIKIGWQIKNPDGSLVRNADGSIPPSVALSVMPA